MKIQFKLISSILVLTLALTATAAGKKAADVKAQENVEAVIYSLANLENDLVPKDILQTNNAAGGNLSASVAAGIAVRFITGLQLYVAIAKSQDISEDTKKKVMPRLADALRTVFIKVGRQHGDDLIDAHLDKTPAALKYVKRTAVDLSRTFTDLFSYGRSANGEIVYKAYERGMRDILGQDLTIEVQKAIVEIGNIQGQGSDDVLRLAFYVPAKEKEDARDLGAAEKILEIRSFRKAAHYSSLATIAATGLVWSVSGWDFVGTMSSYSETTVRVSDAIAFGAIGAAALVKTATGSFKLLPPLKRLIEITEQVDSSGKDVSIDKVPVQFSEIKQPLLARLFRTQARYEKAKRNCKAVVMDFEGINNKFVQQAKP